MKQSAVSPVRLWTLDQSLLNVREVRRQSSDQVGSFWEVEVDVDRFRIETHAARQLRGVERSARSEIIIALLDWQICEESGEVEFEHVGVE